MSLTQHSEDPIQRLGPKQNWKFLLESQYKDISRVLSISEASVFSVGIPIVPPTRTIKRFRLLYYSPFEDFIRSSLANIGTSTLESYCEELESTLEPKLNNTGLYQPTLFERYCVPITLALVAGTLFSLILLSIGSPSILTAVLGVTIALVAFIPCAWSVSDAYRCITFYQVLQTEINRRQGGLTKQNGASKPQLATTR